MRRSAVNRRNQHALGQQLLRGGFFPLFKGFKDLLGSRAYGDIFGEIHPPNRPCRINEKLCRTRNIRVVRSCTAMQQVVTTNDFCLWVRQECIGVAKFLSLAPIDFRRVHTNRDDLNPA
jgi:hypothetical protein